ncbi:hypothetical protein DB345_06330 [Spartobacteria bacterium LR76]|nr:hypothetical protein DB345_06330 [Spartobacteria bacterium LR76]
MVRLLIDTVPPAMKNARSELFMSMEKYPPSIVTFAFTTIWLVAEIFAVSVIVFCSAGLDALFR